MAELQALQWTDINWSNKTLNVRHAWCALNNALESTKSNKERHIPLTAQLHNMLAARKQPSGFVFLDERGRRFESKRLNQEIAIACSKAGIREITCHALRHTFASHLTMKGAPLKAIQELLGHANIQTTMRYAHLAPSSLKDAVSLLDTTG